MTEGPITWIPPANFYSGLVYRRRADGTEFVVQRYALGASPEETRVQLNSKNGDFLELSYPALNEFYERTGRRLSVSSGFRWPT